MSRTTEREGGFTLVEVLVAMVIFALFASASVGLLVGALRSAGINKDGTQARQLAQSDFEKLKGLVFQTATTTTPSLLATDYPNLTAASAVRTTGYVADTSALRSTADGDPATGAFYRTVVSTSPTSTRFARYLTLQFISLRASTGPPAIAVGDALTPAASYLPSDATTLPSTTVRATLTLVWSRFGRRTYSVQSELTTGRASVEKVAGEASIAAFRLSAVDATVNPVNPVKVAVEGPSISLNGSLTDNTASFVNAKGAASSLSTGQRNDGAVGSASAPADEVAPASSAPGVSLAGNGVTYSTFGSSATSGLEADSSYATPLVSKPAAPATAMLSSTSAALPAVRMTLLDAVTSSPPRLRLASTDVVRSTHTCGACLAFTSTGYLKTADTGVVHSVDSSVATTSSPGTGMGLFPTTFAPDGVVNITLTSAALTCHLDGTYPSMSPASVTATYTATVKYWSGNGTTGGYVTLPAVSSANATSPLAGVNLATTQVWTAPDSTPTYLSDYIASWDSATTGSLAALKQSDSTNRLVAADTSGFLSVTTKPVRTSDPLNSAVSVQFGVARCSAGDAR